uniref:c-di-GMP synthase n=1 Tax=Flavobacteriaceae sp. genome_bin_11 TaxID=2778089 RepID=CDNE_FLASX|nr:RecName: Full=c-di-GMP synthase; AltName: Full=FsCdnE; AltName: Full=cGAS/DncV-like nucleotidyltransferase; Short=CD-NTase [Flavobacteriaceae sp. genome_bin_11]
MQKNYLELIKKVRERSNPDLVQMTKMYSETLSGSKLFENKSIEYSDVSIYIKESMKGVAPSYTMNSKVAANKVEAHLKKSHGNLVDFERQGSVMTNTHILKENDVDLVQITNKSSEFDHKGLEKALNNTSVLKTEEILNLKKHKENFSPYQGNQIDDLKYVRLKSELVLSSTYKTVDIEKENSIYVKVTEPERDIDVVTATYYKSVDFMKTNDKSRKGIQIYNKKTGKINDVDYPFLSIERINVKDIISNRRLKNMIRFLKNIKYDCPHIENKGSIRSFHINAICYNIDVKKYEDLHYLDLVSILYQELTNIISNKSYRDNIKSVDGCEYIFEFDCAKKLIEIEFLSQELDSIIADLHNQSLLVG